MPLGSKRSTVSPHNQLPRGGQKHPQQMPKRLGASGSSMKTLLTGSKHCPALSTQCQKPLSTQQHFQQLTLSHTAGHARHHSQRSAEWLTCSTTYRQLARSAKTRPAHDASRLKALNTLVAQSVAQSVASRRSATSKAHEQTARSFWQLSEATGNWT